MYRKCPVCRQMVATVVTFHKHRLQAWPGDVCPMSRKPVHSTSGRPLWA